MNRKPQRKNPYESSDGVRLIFLWLARLVVLFVALAGLATAVAVIYGRCQIARQSGGVIIEGGDPSLNAAERFYLQSYLASHAAELQTPAGTAQGEQSFVVAPGETANTITQKLVTAQLLTDPDLFLNYLRYYGLDSELEAGTFQLDGRYPIPQLAGTLTRAIAQDIELRFLEGWRLEEMGNYLAVTNPANIHANEFLALVKRQTPLDLSPYTFLADLPATASLEGYLFPDTYRVPTTATADYLVNLMLTNFGRRVPPEMQAQIAAQGLTVYEGVTLASIVEREAVVDEERPLIASVFYNRLAQDITLGADPTIQYALGYIAANDSWWKSPLDVADLSIDSPYNTYINLGLPPGPIANPGFSSLQAVASPAVTNYLFFVADCNSATHQHSFSETYDEHLANIQNCP